MNIKNYPRHALNAIVRLRDRGGLTDFNRVLLRALRHPEWIYQARPIEQHRLTFVPPAPVAESDIALCERLITAYHKTPSAVPSALWEEIIQRQFEPLIKALKDSNAAQLASLLSTVFRDSLIEGIGTGAYHTHARTRLGSYIWNLRLLDNIVSLAESLGVTRTECPEQGVPAYALQKGVAHLIQLIEQKLGMDIGFPRLGATYGYVVGEALITPESPEHIYVASRIDRAIEMHLRESAPNGSTPAPHIVEIGAGFGGTAFWLLKLRSSVARYTIVDLPLVNVMQGYFLSKARGESDVAFFGEERTDARVRILPTEALDSIEGPVHVLINENSMPEIPEAAVRGYLGWAKDHVQGIFYSYNQEAYSPVAGVPQVLVPQVARETGAFALESRNPSWLRRGYVEEVYTLPAMSTSPTA